LWLHFPNVITNSACRIAPDGTRTTANEISPESEPADCTTTASDVNSVNKAETVSAAETPSSHVVVA